MPRLTRYDSIAVRVLAALPDRPQDGCWIWQGTIGTNGYGQIKWLGRLYKAHRLLYTLLVKEVAPCCNLTHLEEVTHAENIVRGNLWNRRKTRCPKGHPYNAENTYVRPDGRRRCRQCKRDASHAV